MSSRSTQEISLDERRYENGAELELLDIVQIPMLKPVPYFYQSENHLIDSHYYWARMGTYPVDAVGELCDDVESLWVNGHHSYNGVNDRIPEAEAHRSIGTSLGLIRPERTTVHVIRGYHAKREVRAEFTYRGATYQLRITDPEVERTYLCQPDGEYRVDSPLAMCVSIGEPFQHYCYKLVAAMIPLDG